MYEENNLERLKTLTQELIDRDFSLKRSKVLLESIIKATHDGIYEFNLITKKIKWSDSLYILLGYFPGEINIDYDFFVSQIHPDDFENREKILLNSIKEKIPYSVEYRIKCKNKEYKWINVKGIVRYNEVNDTPFEVIGAVRDIEELKCFQKRYEEISKLLEDVLSEKKCSNCGILERFNEIKQILK